MPNWIDIKTKLPPEEEVVLIIERFLVGDAEPTFGFLRKGIFWSFNTWDGYELKAPYTSHWLSIPPFQKEEQP